MSEHTNPKDVVICGGGLAGLALARQLLLRQPELSILVLEKQQRPLPDSAFKVGESTIESGAYYYAQTLELEDYVEECHLEKLGLRYFYGPGKDVPFHERCEFGVARYLPAKSYQLDRGLLETKLRELVLSAGATLLEGANLKEIQLAEGDQAHKVTYRDGDQTHTVSCRWVVDAMGRRRYLQRKLGLDRENQGCFSSVWFRIEGKLSVDRFVDESHSEWHDRVKEDRWGSTNHLMGSGYWVWLIPLSPGNTSVGIVTDQDIHPFESYDTHEKAMAWLEEWEPELHRHLQTYPVMDFLKLKNYSYTSAQMFSGDRWACVGEAGAFADPYYSVGSNMIAFANGLTTELILRDMEQRLEDSFVEHANRLFLTLNDALTHNIHISYPYHHKPVVMAMKTIWDYYIGWTTTDPQLYHEVFLNPTMSKAMSNLIQRVIVAQGRMVHLFNQWAQHPEQHRFDFIDYIEDLPTLTKLFTENLPPKDPRPGPLLARLKEAVDRIEELAQIIFFFALECTQPEQLSQFDVRWINIEAIGLKPENWERDGLFRPKTKARDYAEHRREIERLFTPLRKPAGVGS